MTRAFFLLAMRMRRSANRSMLRLFSAAARIKWGKVTKNCAGMPKPEPLSTDR